MQTLKPTLTIDIWSDLVCPWCWIAKKRFEQGLNRFEFRDQVVIRHHSYRLAGGTPAMPFKDAIVKKLGSQHSAELMMNQVGTAGKSEGLIYNFDGMMFGDTEDGVWYAELISDQTPISSIRNKLLFGKDFAMKKVS